MTDFVRVFTASTTFEAHFVRSVFEQHELDAIVRNDSFSPYNMIQPEVLVARDQVEAAEAVLAELARVRVGDGALSVAPTDDEAGRLSLEESAGAVSLCRTCGEENPRNFETCWQCGEAIA